MITIRDDLITHMVIQDTSYDQGDLIVCDHLFVCEVIHAGMFELLHSHGRNISSHEDWNFGWHLLFNRGHGCFCVWHIMQ